MEIYRKLIEIILMTSSQMLNEYLNIAAKARNRELETLEPYLNAIEQIGLRMEELREDETFQTVMMQLSGRHRLDFAKTLEVLKNFHVYLAECKDYDTAGEMQQSWESAKGMIPWKDPKATA